jgi:ribonuclease HII
MPDGPDLYNGSGTVWGGGGDVPDFALEDSIGGIVAGVDEAGRGPLAGPVVAAAVILPRDAETVGAIEGLDDSKRLSAAQREHFFAIISARAEVGVGIAEVAEIDDINILRASLAAMVRAVRRLPRQPGCILVDGNIPPPELKPLCRCIVKGDGLSLSIAAASVIAKVTRDRLMTDLAIRFPGYGWEHNAGYATPEHRAALIRLGATPVHRRSFEPVSQILGTDSPRLPHIE